MNRDQEFLGFLYNWTHTLVENRVISLDPFDIVGRDNISSVRCWLNGFTIYVRVPQGRLVQSVLPWAKRVLLSLEINLGLQCQYVKDGKVFVFCGVPLSRGRQQKAAKRLENRNRLRSIPMHYSKNLSKSLTDGKLRRLLVLDKGATVFVHRASDTFEHLFIKPDQMVKDPEKRLNKPILDLLGQPLTVVDSDIAEIKRDALERCRDSHGVIWREYSHIWKGYEFNFLYKAQWMPEDEIVTWTIDHPDKKPVGFPDQRAMFEYVNELVEV